MVSEKALRATAKELNEVMEGLNPPIDEEANVSDLTATIREAITFIDPEVDKFSKATQAVIDELSDPTPIEEGIKEKEEKAPPTLWEMVDDCQKISDLKDLAKTNAEFKSIRSKLNSFKTADILRDAMLDILEESANKQKMADKIHKQNIADAPINQKKVVEEEKEPEVKEVKEEEKAPEVKEKKPRAAKQSTLVGKIEFFTPLIRSGKYTQKELVEQGLVEYPHLVRSTLQTFLTDSKNKKYNKFPKLVVVGKDDKLSFEK